MLKTTLKNLWLYFKKGFYLLWKAVSHAAVSWPKAFAAVVVLLILSYYPLGAYLSEKIDKTTDYNLLKESEQQSMIVETITLLINREVNQNLWTANLPMFFPAYFLDNMPNYQKGIVSSLAIATSAIAQQTQCPEDVKEKQLINNAAKLLRYPPNIWLFAPDNQLKIAPSSATQYRKARKMLKDYNRLLPQGECLWNYDASDLNDLVSVIKKDLSKAAQKLENQANEHSSDFFDANADDLFYFCQGKMYAYMLILKSAGMDFKQVLIDSHQYETWTKIISTLENGIALSPSVVRNAELDNVFASNHLIILAFYIMRAVNLLGEMDVKNIGVSL